MLINARGRGFGGVYRKTGTRKFRRAYIVASSAHFAMHALVINFIVVSEDYP
jgi:hypothetical protein